MHCPRWTLHLNHLPAPGPSVSWVHRESTVSGVPCVSSGELISGCDPPGRCQPSKIPAGSLLTVWWRMLAKIAAAPCLPALAVAQWPLCLQQWGGACTQPLALFCYWLSPLFCEQARLGFRAFCSKVLFFFPSL